MDALWTPAPGLYRDIAPDTYHAVRALSASGLKLLRQSPAHYYGQTLDPARPARPDTKALTNGSLTHCLLLEPGEFDARYAVVPEDAPNRPTSIQRKAAKQSEGTLRQIAWWDAFARGIAGKTIVEADWLASSKAQAAAVRAIPELSALLSDGYGEASAFWHDPETGVLCKCRPDWTSPAGDGVILIDGKTTRDAGPEGFGRAIWNLGYHLQAAWYSDGFERATGIPVRGFVFAAVESAWPHAAAAYMLDDTVLEQSRAECRRLTNLYAECLRTGRWPGYASGIQLINLPRWARLSENDE